MHPDPQRLEDISSIRDAMRQIRQEAEAVVELLVRQQRLFNIDEVRRAS
jgi:hypothetical protein